MKATLRSIIGVAVLGMTLVASGSAQSAPPPGGPPGHAPEEITGSVEVTNFPANQDVTVSNVVDVNVVGPERVQISIVGGATADTGPVTGFIERADGGGVFAVVPIGTKLVLTDFVVRVSFPTDPVIGDSDHFLGNISRAQPGSDCGSSVRRKQFRVFRRDQVIASLATGLEYYAGERVCLATGAPGDNPRNVELSYQINGYLTAE
jgi:hypothetical protein